MRCVLQPQHPSKQICKGYEPGHLRQSILRPATKAPKAQKKVRFADEVGGTADLPGSRPSTRRPDSAEPKDGAGATSARHETSKSRAGSAGVDYGVSENVKRPAAARSLWQRFTWGPCRPERREGATVSSRKHDTSRGRVGVSETDGGAAEQRTTRGPGRPEHIEKPGAGSGRHDTSRDMGAVAGTDGGGAANVDKPAVVQPLWLLPTRGPGRLEHRERPGVSSGRHGTLRGLEGVAVRERGAAPRPSVQRTTRPPGSFEHREGPGANSGGRGTSRGREEVADTDRGAAGSGEDRRAARLLGQRTTRGPGRPEHRERAGVSSGAHGTSRDRGFVAAMERGAATTVEELGAPYPSGQRSTRGPGGRERRQRAGVSSTGHGTSRGPEGAMMVESGEERIGEQGVVRGHLGALPWWPWAKPGYPFDRIRNRTVCSRNGNGETTSSSFAVRLFAGFSTHGGSRWNSSICFC